jgi:hypothetical protein
MGARPSAKHSIDRVDNEKGYWCGRCGECLGKSQNFNCKWATDTEQAKNTRMKRMLTANGETLHISEWAKKLNTSCGTLIYRLKAGFSVHEAINTPIRRFRR